MREMAEQRLQLARRLRSLYFHLSGTAVQIRRWYEIAG